MDLLTDLLKFTSASDSLLFTDQGKRPEELEEHSYESRT